MPRMSLCGALLVASFFTPAPSTAQTNFTDFETGMGPWTADATDLALGGGEIEWHVKRTDVRASSGRFSVECYMKNHNDAGKIWIEAPFALRPNTFYDVQLRFRLGSNNYADIGAFQIIAGASTRDPEVRTDLKFQESTHNGGVRDYVWLDKRYSLRPAATDASGRLWIAIGIWGTFEITQTYYLDDVSVTFSVVGETPTPTPTPRPTATPTPRPGLVEITPGRAGVTASTSDANVPGNTVDNQLATRWSGFGDGAWIRYDLGSVRTVSYVTIAVWQGATRQNTFDLQLSRDGVSWKTVLTRVQTRASAAEETYDFADDAARYVQYVGHGSTVGLWNSLTEVSLFGPPVGP